MKKTKNIFIAVLLILTFQACTAQTSETKNICNRKTADKSLAKRLPKGICIRDGYTVDEVITNFDFNRDKKPDVVIRYGKYPLKNGMNRFYSVFERVSDSVFVIKKELKNIIPPYLDNVYAASSSSDSLASTLVQQYPYDLKIEFNQDTIKLSHLIPDFYGKTYEFVFDKQFDNWRLKRINYWIGDLDERDIEQMGLSPKLSKRNIIEKKIPNNAINIEQFSLIESRTIADSEEKDYFMNSYNLLEWSEKNK